MGRKSKAIFEGVADEFGAQGVASGVDVCNSLGSRG